MNDTEERLTRLEAKVDALLELVEQGHAAIEAFMAGPGKKLARMFGKLGGS
jgi:hypothetical protein